MADGPEKTVERLQSFVPVEKSLSIDPHVERDKQQDTRRRKRKPGAALTVQERLAQEESLRLHENENEDHVDYHA